MSADSEPSYYVCVLDSDSAKESNAQLDHVLQSWRDAEANRDPKQSPPKGRFSVIYKALCPPSPLHAAPPPTTSQAPAPPRPVPPRLPT